MSFQALIGEVIYPTLPRHQDAGGWSLTTLGPVTVNGGGVAQHFRCPRDVTVDRLLFRTRSVTSTDATVTGAIYTISATTGLPDAVIGGTGTVTPIAADTTYELTLTPNTTLTGGVDYAMVFTISGAATPNMHFASPNASGAAAAGYPYGFANYTNGGWAKDDLRMVCGIRDQATGVYVYLDDFILPIGGTGDGAPMPTGTIASTGNVKRGLYFQVPFTCKMNGCWVRGRITPAASTFDIEFGTPGAEASILTKNTSILEHNTQDHYYFLRFSSAQTLLAATNYRLVIVPAVGATFTLTEVVCLDGTNGSQFGALAGGQAWKLTNYAGGQWDGGGNPTANRRPWMGLLLSELSDTSAAGDNVISIVSPHVSVGQVSIMKYDGTSLPIAANRRIPFTAINSADGTPYTGGGWANADIQLSKNGEAEFACLATSIVHRANGEHYYECRTTDIDTYGYLRLRVAKTGVVAMRVTTPIIASNQFDPALSRIRPDAIITGTVTADAGNTSSKFKTSLTIADNVYNRCWVRFTSGALLGQAAKITDSGNITGPGVNSLDITPEAFTGTPAGSVSFVIVNG